MGKRNCDTCIWLETDEEDVGYCFWEGMNLFGDSEDYSAGIKAVIVNDGSCACWNSTEARGESHE